MATIGIINYGVGNIASVKNAIEHIGARCELLHHPSEIERVDKLILPGVGAFEVAMYHLQHGGWDKALHSYATLKPILGLCLGMQLLLEESEEHGIHKGLGLVQGKVKSLKSVVADLPVPHMGWNALTFQKQSALLNGVDPTQNDVYFVHSFYCELSNRNDVLATTNYGIEIDVMLQKDSIFGCQFHPEKSQVNGLQILKNFSAL